MVPGGFLSLHIITNRCLCLAEYAISNTMKFPLSIMNCKGNETPTEFRQTISLAVSGNKSALRRNSNLEGGRNDASSGGNAHVSGQKKKKKFIGFWPGDWPAFPGRDNSSKFGRLVYLVVETRDGNVLFGQRKFILDVIKQLVSCWMSNAQSTVKVISGQDRGHLITS